MTREGRAIVDRVSSAIASASIFPPAALKEAVKALKAGISINKDEEPVVQAFIKFLEDNAARKDELLRKAFGERNGAIK
jgi:hypothetical protein